MNLISKLLPEPNVMLDLDVASKKRVFEQAGPLFENNNQIARSQVFDSLFAREKLGSTGLGRGIAIPHGRVKGLRKRSARSRARSSRSPSTPPTASRWS
jgi:PTS system nitrogen regulatory IIA component